MKNTEHIQQQKINKPNNNVSLKIFSILNSISNFIKSSMFSLLLIGVLALLVSQAKQMSTLLISMLENKYGSINLLISFFLINALAILVSHYPIYIFYAKKLRNSGNSLTWSKEYLFRNESKIFSIFTFRFKDNNTYKIDILVNSLRYSLGLMVFGIWLYFIFLTFEQKVEWISHINKFRVAAIFTIAFSIWQYRLRAKLKNQDDKGKTNYLKQKIKWFYGSSIFTILVLVLFKVFLGFNGITFYLLLLITVLSTINLIYFRLLRAKFDKISDYFEKKSKIVKFFSPFTWLSDTKNYLRSYILVALLCLIYIIAVNYLSVTNGKLPNSIPIVLAYLYLYYWAFASFVKYLYVSNQVKNQEDQNKAKTTLVWVTGISLAILFLTNSIFKEINIHQLTVVDNADSQQLVSEENFINSLSNHESDTLFFITSFGGGLKANAWTLEVLNKLQKITKGRLLDKTIAMSGASGGSLGLALYSSLYKNYQTDFSILDEKIETISLGNYTSIGLGMGLGIDMIRKVVPFSWWSAIKDRPYYTMLKYQNIIHRNESDALIDIPYREYWADLYNDARKNDKHFPSLIMNTAGTKGNRGILWSVKTNNFDKIFHYAMDLAELPNSKTLPYFQAVSMTNRFPVFSPAAKIDSVGHFMDSGAIDNSGLLGCLDLYSYLLSHKEQPLNGKTIVFIEITNSKGNYIDKIIHDTKYKNALELSIEENESDGVIVNLRTGLNLDKIPQYLHHFLIERAKRDTCFEHIAIHLPVKLSIEDIEGYKSGEIKNENQRKQLINFLGSINTNLNAVDKVPEGIFSNVFEDWKYYEPTLSRHLSRSSLRYMKESLKDTSITSELNRIKNLTK